MTFSHRPTDGGPPDIDDRILVRAFDYHKESNVYDALAKSVDGELLRQMYLDITESLRVKEQGGAIARVNEVQFVEGKKTNASISPEDSTPQFRYRCKWNLIGTIEHWGHIHERENKYAATFKIQLREDVRVHSHHLKLAQTVFHHSLFFVEVIH